MKRRLKPWVVILFIIICLCVMAYSVINIVMWNMNMNKNEQIHQELKGFIKINEETKEDNEEKNKYLIDFDKLKEINPDTVAYLKVNGTELDYIVVKGLDNAYYLKHNFYKEWNRAGWIFANYQNRFDGTDKNITIFGHNMKNDLMFGTLKRVLTNDWQTEPDNLKITLVTENEESTYQVFSTYKVLKEDYYIKSDFVDNEFEEFVNVIKSRSNYNYNVEVTKDDSILTLSTCDNDNKYRVVLHAKKI